MRKILIGIISALFLNAAYADPVPPRVMRNLKGYHIMRASLLKSALRLVTTHDAVSRDVYENIISEGVCSVLLADPEKGWAKTRIDRIEVMNRDERQGYVFADARNACLELGEIGDKNTRETWFAGKTGTCTREICNDPAPGKKERPEK